MVTTWAPDDFWQVAQPLIPVPARRPQGGGKRRADDRAVLAAIVYLVQAGCSWAKLPAVMFGVGRSTVHRRFTEWTEAGLWVRLHQQFLHRLGVVSEVDWSRVVVDSIDVRAEKGAIRSAQIRLIAASRVRKFGYCPELSSWPAVATACEQVGLEHPGEFTAAFEFRRCVICGRSISSKMMTSFVPPAMRSSRGSGTCWSTATRHRTELRLIDSGRPDSATSRRRCA
jgi:transposase